MIGNLCATDVAREDNRNNIERLWRQWTNRDKNIWKVHGESEHSRRSFEEFGESILEKPIHDNVMLSEAEIARIHGAMNKYNRKIEKGKFVNPFEDYFFVPEGISFKDPVARFFYKSLNQAVNYERVNLSKANGLQRIVAEKMRAAYINAGYQGRWRLGNKFFDKITDLSHKIKTSDNEADKTVYENDLKKLVDVDEKTFGPSSLLGEYKTLMTLSKAEFESRGLRQRNIQGEKTEQRYNPDVYEAAAASRSLTNEMGLVTIRGLDYLKTAIKYKLVGTVDKNALEQNASYGRIEKAIDEAKIRIQKGIDIGGYLPGYTMGDLISLKEAASTFWGNTSTNQRTLQKDLNVMDNVLSSLNKEAIPTHARPKQEAIAQKYEENPMFILNQYAMDAVAFNKLAFTKSKYLETMKRLSESKDLQWVDGMKKFIDEEFQISTEGLVGRDDWINNSIRTIMSVQVARTMGLNFTGAVVNATSIQFAAAHLGFSEIAKAKHNYLNGVTPTGEKMQKIVARVEEQSGFLFNDVAAELISEGLLPPEGINKSKYTYDVESNKILDNGTPLLDKLRLAQDWTVEKGLMFHRVTENFTRQWMYRTAFMKKFNELSAEVDYVKDLKIGRKKSYAAVEQKASDWALEFVNQFAFEYAIHAKSKVARGIPPKDVYGNKEIRAKVIAGAAGQLGFQLTHYPFSLMQQQARKLRGGWDAVKVGQWDANEMSYLYRYFALFSALQVGSILLNSDLNGMIPNETLEKLKQIENDFTAPLDPSDETMTYGLLSEFTGPSLGHAKFGVMVSGLLNEDPGYLQQLMLGNVDYIDDKYDKYKWYQLSTEIGRFKTKIGPAIADGRGMDVFRHYFRIYPGELPYPGLDVSTKDARQIVGENVPGLGFLKKKKKRKKKKKKASLLDTQSILNSLDKI
tara:strand:+ start:6191 stop:8929 length:2739 start_codon:yes stop_codon:yes gene_type:complete